MKVRELQEHLSKLDPNLEVVCYSEDEDLSAQGRPVSLFDIVEISTTEAEISRTDEGVLWPRFERGPASNRYAFVEITSDH